MPEILKIEHKDGQRTAVWEIQEDEYALLTAASLTDTDAKRFSLIPNPWRRLEWLTTRVLLRSFYPRVPTIEYLENGKPFLVNNTDKISVSHSGKMVALALHPSQNPGIDIEMLHPRIFKIATRFLSDTEKDFLGENPSLEQLTAMWGAKEVMFKVYEFGGISFKDDFRIQPFSISKKGKLNGIIQKGGKTIPIPMEYMQIGDYMLIQTDYNHRDFEKNSEL
jgi:4'-phosphopantetheinyl transferase